QEAGAEARRGKNSFTHNRGHRDRIVAEAVSRIRNPLSAGRMPTDCCLGGISSRGIYNGRRGCMLDPTFVRDNLPAVRDGLRRRGMNPDKALEDLAALLSERRRLIPEFEELKRQQNASGEE